MREESSRDESARTTANVRAKPAESRRPGAFRQIAIAASVLGLIALGIYVTAIVTGDGVPKTAVPDDALAKNGRDHGVTQHKPPGDAVGSSDGATERPGQKGSDGPMTRTSSGLQYRDVLEGTGERPSAGQTCVMHYTGWLWENNQKGEKFDSSKDRGRPFPFPLGRGQVIKGWDEGVATMKVGGKRELIIPSDLAYGARGSGRSIPPNSTLFFEVELLEVK
jgi:peptidylprolyl isomerase